jgi:hypothetical protein
MSFKEIGNVGSCSPVSAGGQGRCGGGRYRSSYNISSSFLDPRGDQCEDSEMEEETRDPSQSLSST